MVYGATELWAFLLALARVSALMVTAPVFGNRAVPRTAKVGLSALLAFALQPLIRNSVTTPPHDLLALLGGIGAELAVGLCLGYLAAFCFAAIQMAGAFVDSQIGFGIINILNPYTETHNSALGQFFSQMTMALFLIANGHLFLLATLLGSYAAVGPAAAQLDGELTTVFAELVSRIFVLAFQLAIPIAAVLLLVDVSFAILARTMPQMNVFIVGMPAKVIIGLLTVAMVLPMMASFAGSILPAIATGSTGLLRAVR